MTNSELLKHCIDFNKAKIYNPMSHAKNYNFKCTIPDSIKDGNQVIEYIIKNDFQDIRPNIYIAIYSF